MKESLETRELLSALADNQGAETACFDLLDSCTFDDAALECWSTYHLIGERLRVPGSVCPPQEMGDDLAFVRRLRSRLANEEAIAHVPVPLAISPATVAHTPLPPTRQAANDGNFRWKLVAGLATLAAVATIAWNASGLETPSSLAQLALVSAPQIVVASPNGTMVRDLKLEEMLAAHRQFGTATALQESSGFLRNATFEMPRETLPGSGR